MRAAKTSYIVLSALYCVFGVLLIAVPDFSMKLLGILVGCMMIGFGAVKLMGYFSRDLYRLAFQFDLAYGILLIVLGLIVLVRPVQLVSFFCLVLGICILADGLFKIQAASDSKRFGLRPWWLILTLAIVAPQEFVPAGDCGNSGQGNGTTGEKGTGRIVRGRVFLL